MNFTQRLIIFEEKLKDYFNLHILSIEEKRRYKLVDKSGAYIKENEQDTTRLVNIYSVYGECSKVFVFNDYIDKDDCILLWLFKYEVPGIFRISNELPSERLKNFIRLTNRFFEGIYEEYVDAIF